MVLFTEVLFMYIYFMYVCVFICLLLSSRSQVWSSSLWPSWPACSSCSCTRQCGTTNLPAQRVLSSRYTHTHRHAHAHAHAHAHGQGQTHTQKIYVGFNAKTVILNILCSHVFRLLITSTRLYLCSTHCSTYYRSPLTSHNAVHLVPGSQHALTSVTCRRIQEEPHSLSPDDTLLTWCTELTLPCVSAEESESRRGTRETGRDIGEEGRGRRERERHSPLSGQAEIGTPACESEGSLIRTERD